MVHVGGCDCSKIIANEKEKSKNGSMQSVVLRIYLIILRSKKYLAELSQVTNQWLLSDIIFIVLLYLIYLTNQKIGDVVSSLFILVISFLASIIDYWRNRALYFP